MKKTDQYRRSLLERYREQVTSLEDLTAGLSAEQVRVPLEEGGWNAHRVLAHLRDVERQAFLPRLERILREDRPALENFDEEAWAEEHYDPDEPVASVLAGFRQARQQAVELTAGLEAAAWSRTGHHPLRGERTLQWWVEYATAHTDEHLEQIRKGLGR